MTASIDQNRINRKKLFILWCGFLMYFLTSMSKTNVPATVFENLQSLGLDAKQIANTGAYFMYAYALSQLLTGIYSDRYGGVKILLIGGTLFTIGAVGFPLTSNFYLMLLFRMMTGFGSGTIFVGVVKLISDLYSKCFTLVMGISLIFGFSGAAAGTAPMVLMVQQFGWRWALLIVGLVGLLLTAIVVLLSPGTIKQTVPGQTFAPFFKLMKNKAMWKVGLATAPIGATYYVILGQIGIKSLTDSCSISPEKASTVLLIMSIAVASNSMLANVFLKFTGDRRKPVQIFFNALSLIGCIIAYFNYNTTPQVWVLAIAYILLAFPGGGFALYSTIAKEVNPPEQTGLAVSILNFIIWTFCALFQNISGISLKMLSPEGATIFPNRAYSGLFLILTIAAVIAISIAFMIPETRNRAKTSGTDTPATQD